MTIQAPDHSYPGTDFNNAFFTVSVHPHLTASECQRFEDVNVIGASDKKISLSGIEFRGAQLGFAGAGHQFFVSYYHGFSKGVCYEFGYGVATSGYGAVDGMTQVNSAEVLSLLENVLKTVTIKPPAPGK